MDTIVKQRADAPPGFFEAEAAGIRWLEQAGGARVAAVVDVSPGRIELERVEHAAPTQQAAHEFGRGLAKTHQAGAPTFGSPPEGWDGPLFIGRREMPSIQSKSWGEFYAEGRVHPFAQAAVQAGNLTESELRVVEQACEAVAEGEFDDDAPPSRIHGDLWGGNVLFSPRGVVIIDPAAHGGHAETDLAMLALFGVPHLHNIIGGYESVAPLLTGWQERVPLHQLHPLAVHAAGHGRAYGVELTRAARATLALANQ
ncbi:fructosamine kinase family protein [Demequina sp. TTPB684]|uniref:fructosamine kinase family protein n=1 Tax=unclassified Demequina TaxID=2620311 RepID=UPI001CF18AA1|nr:MULTISPECIES: fructosamine kinase family protein [unclassified Demequina]MCB2412743.1 fructosamine kinase family protein [Demequina sp. TTPB684]UPU88879.1 fructosamine kinase family protein [Demequina sp. TMPB413]